MAESGNADLKQALAWSVAVNKAIADMVRGVPPFPLVRECLDKFGDQADMLVCSQTPTAALEVEWAEHGIARFVRAICGQEAGSKKEILHAAKNYPPGHTLMIGDAPGDQRAAEANKCLFFPDQPGAEEASWKRLFEEGIDRFFAGTFAGEYQQQLLDEFEPTCRSGRPGRSIEERIARIGERGSTKICIALRLHFVFPCRDYGP